MCAFVSGLLSHVRQLLQLSFRMDDMTEPTANQSPCCHDWGRRVQSVSHCSYSTNRKSWWIPIIITLSPFTDAPRTISINMEINTAVQCERYDAFNDMKLDMWLRSVKKKRPSTRCWHHSSSQEKWEALPVKLSPPGFYSEHKGVSELIQERHIIAINGETQTCCRVWIHKETSWNWCARGH